MRQCVNPNCEAAREGRLFNADDQICPRCGQPLEDTDPLGNPISQPSRGTTPAVAGIQWLIAVLTLILVIGAAFGCSGAMGLIPFFRPATAGTPTVVVLAPVAATTTAEAGLVLLTSTPIVLPTQHTTAVAGGSGPTFTPVAGAGTGANGTGTNGTGTNSNGITPATVGGSQTNSGASPYVIPGVSDVRLCQRLAGGQTCDPVTTYSPTASFYVAVRAGFGPGGATTAQARLYGPDGLLLHSTDTLTPNRVGTYWIGFTFSQSQPWAPGNYQAEIDLDGVNMRQVTISVAP